MYLYEADSTKTGIYDSMANVAKVILADLERRISFFLEALNILLHD